jgi:hypothetical protein
MFRSRSLALAAALALGGCPESIAPGKNAGSPSKPSTDTGGSMTGGGTGGGTTDTLPPLGTGGPDRTTAACKTINPGPSPLRRLTHEEYDRTVHDLLGDTKHPARDFPAEEIDHGFDNSAELRSVSDVLSESYLSAAEQLATAAVADMKSLLPCDPATTGESACLDQLLDGFGKRAWRRPLTTDERAHLQRVFADDRGVPTGGTFADGAQAVIEVMLLSPQFLYRVERGVPVAGTDYARLDHFEMAARLSYTLWGTMPDEPLFAAATAGKLGTREEIAAQARRMIDDPRTTDMVTGFAGQWLQLDKLDDSDKDVTVYKTFTPELLALFRKETEAFVQNVWQGDPKLTTLLTAPYTMVNGPLAQFYGLTGVSGDAFQKAPVPTGRAGFLTQGSFLAANAAPDQTSPVHRGQFVREQLFCQDLPPPPPDVNANPPALDPKMTTAERFAAHRADPRCASCHDLMDPIGLGFENFDGVGLWRSMENGKAVDAHGHIAGTDVEGDFNGALELTGKLAASKGVSSCMVTHWFRFGNGRDSSADDACSVETLTGAFQSGSLRDLLLALVETDSFLFRKGAPQ